MKMSRIKRYVTSALLLGSAISVLPGCKSATWMPGSKLFSWNRDPDPSLLATAATEPDFPTSPASRHEPATIASLGNQSPTGSSYAARPSSGYGIAAQAVSTPKAGLAAQANGYQTGAYPMGAPTSTPTTAASGLPSPYGGSYAGTAASAAQRVQNTAANLAAAGSAYSAAAQNAYASSPYGTAGSTLPVASGLPSSTPGLPLPGASTYPVSSTAAGLPTAGMATSVPALPSPGGLPTSMPTTPSMAATAVGLPFPTAGGLPTAGSAVSAPTAYRGTTTLGGFSPGTTGRSTGYDFGSAAGTAPTTLPPNTASGSGALLR